MCAYLSSKAGGGLGASQAGNNGLSPRVLDRTEESERPGEEVSSARADSTAPSSQAMSPSL